MYIWYSRWTCLGYIFCPLKLHQFVNEWHTACCELSIILFVVDFVEGKAYPHQVRSIPGKLVQLSLKNLVGIPLDYFGV